jgi:hypothetical protein
LATAKEIYQALNEKVGFKPDKEWSKDSFTRKDIIPGKVYIYFQTGTGEECEIPNFGFGDNGLRDKELSNLKVELHNIIHGEPEEAEGGYYFVYVRDLEDRTVNYYLKMMEELERRILFELTTK